MKYRLKRLIMNTVKSKTRCLILLFVLTAICLTGGALYNRFVPDSVLELLKNEAVNTINLQSKAVVSTYLAEDESFRDRCITPERDANGNITSYRINTECLERAQSIIVSTLERSLRKRGTISVSLPVGTLSGVKYLEGKGPKVKIRSHTVSAVNSNVTSSAESVGLNQSIYRATLSLEVTCTLSIGGVRETVVYTTSANLLEVLILGEVPLSPRN